MSPASQPNSPPALPPLTLTPPSAFPPPPGLAVPLPGYSPLPDPPPGPANPDPPPPGPDGGGSASSPAGSSTPASFKGKSGAYAAIAKGLLMAAGGWLNRAAAGDDDDNLAFLPDEDDEKTIPPPLGRLAARRIKLGDGTENLSDLEDIGMAVVGLIAWLAKGSTELIQRRRERKRIEKGAAVYGENADPDPEG